MKQVKIRKRLRHKLRNFVAMGAAAYFFSGGIAVIEAAAPEVSVNAVVAAASIQDIAGIWHEEGVLDSRTLTVNGDGTYELAYKGGGKSFGLVKITYEEHPDGSKTSWYSFYENDGTLWMGAARNEKQAVQTDLRSGYDGAMHFVRSTEKDYHKTSAGVKAEAYEGIWSCGRCNIQITKERNGGYLVEVSWASNAAEGSRWVYHCTYDSYSALLFCNDKGVKTDYRYINEDKMDNKEIYADGSSIFVLREGVLHWLDKKENSGEEMDFLR